MIKNSKSGLWIICILAFAVAAYFLVFKRNRNAVSNGEGHSVFKVETFQENKGWGYRIYQDTMPLVEQKYLPGIPGSLQFESRELAQKTGELVQKKLEAGIFPPSVSERELDSLGIKF